MEKKPLYRQASLDRLNSPEQLNDYIRVVKPSMVLLLAAIILLLAGALTWAVFGTITTRVTAVAECVNGQAVCYVDAADAQRLKAGMAALLGDFAAEVKDVSDEPLRVGDDQVPLQTGNGFKLGDVCYRVTLAADRADDGVYAAEIVVERIAPIRVCF